MTATNITVDMETAKLIASGAAEQAAKAVAQELRADIRADMEGLEERITQKLDNYFGKLDASDHVIQHDRIERLLNLFDRMGENVVSSILKNVIWGLLVLGIVGYLGWQHFVGGGA